MRRLYLAALLLVLVILLASVDASCKGSRCTKRRKNMGDRTTGTGAGTDDRERREGHRNVDELKGIEDKKKDAPKEEEKESSESSEKKDATAQAQAGAAAPAPTRQRRAADDGDSDNEDECEEPDERNMRVRRHHPDGKHAHPNWENNEHEGALRYPESVNEAVDERLQRELEKRHMPPRGVGRTHVRGGHGHPPLPLPDGADELLNLARE